MPKLPSPDPGRLPFANPKFNSRVMLRKVVLRLTAGAFALALACSCEKAPPPPPPTPPPTPTPTPKPKPTPTPTPTPVPTPTPTPTPTPKPTPVKFAPEGVYFLMEDVSVRLPAGILGVVAGTQVKLLKDNGDTLHVTDGHDEYDVKKSQVTNEYDIARRVRKESDATAVEEARAHAQAEAIRLKQERDQIEYLKSHPLSTPTPSPGRH